MINNLMFMEEKLIVIKNGRPSIKRCLKNFSALDPGMIVPLLENDWRRCVKLDVFEEVKLSGKCLKCMSN